MVTRMSVRGFMVSMSPPVVTHTISANGCVTAPATRFILSLLISPDGVIIPLSKVHFSCRPPIICGAKMVPGLTKPTYTGIWHDIKGYVENLDFKPFLQDVINIYRGL